MIIDDKYKSEIKLRSDEILEAINLILQAITLYEAIDEKKIIVKGVTK